MIEIFVDIKDYEGLYQISNFGRVKSLWFNKERIIKSFPGTGGYMHLNIKKNGTSRNVSIHRLVATHFINNTTNKPDVNHIDGNKGNNTVENLEWCTKSENINHSFLIGTHKRFLGESNFNSKLNKQDVADIKRKYKAGNTTLNNLALEYGLKSKSSIHRIIIGKSWSHVNV